MYYCPDASTVIAGAAHLTHECKEGLTGMARTPPVWSV